MQLGLPGIAHNVVPGKIQSLTAAVFPGKFSHKALHPDMTPPGAGLASAIALFLQQAAYKRSVQPGNVERFRRLKRTRDFSHTTLGILETPQDFSRLIK